jgi:CheY-like chemotaxis protein/anti-sigma regulatory factor (Ser/Thr protein kinase)
VLGDVGRFRQVLTNLVGNAIKFTERGHVLVELAGKPVDAATVDLTIRVEDTGLGIPADKIEAVFDKFSQVDGSSTRRHEGTGLGLAITSRLVTLMNGQIGVESEVGRGSVFTVDLRMRADQSQKPLVRHFADVAGARVLIVDDNKVNRDILMAQLASWGCDACAAQSAEEGLAFLEAAAGMGVVVDCIVLDHHMPRMTGIEMARELRARPAMADIPVVLLTSVDVDPKADRLAELRLSAWLTKPAREALLLDTLGKVIDRAPADAEADAGAPSKTAPAAVVAPALARAVARPAPKASAASENGPEDGAPEGQYLDLWMDSEGLAESVAGIGAALSWDDADEASHTDRELERRAQSGGRAIADAVAARRLDILVAEDNEVNQIVFSQILDDLDVVYRIVGNGALAVEEYDRVPPRLILMDVSMPVMNGHQASRAIRQKEAGGDRHVPIIGVTAHALKGDREACIEAGMDDYLSKPISPETLEAKIRQWLGARSGPIAARAG